MPREQNLFLKVILRNEFFRRDGSMLKIDTKPAGWFACRCAMRVAFFVREREYAVLQTLSEKGRRRTVN
jgi:hypothetical protein